MLLKFYDSKVTPVNIHGNRNVPCECVLTIYSVLYHCVVHNVSYACLPYLFIVFDFKSCDIQLD